ETFEERLKWTESICGTGRPHSVGHTPFWRFLNRLTMGLFGGQYFETADRWGWSNLLKIAWSRGRPKEWPVPLANLQRNAARTALREELAWIRECLVFIGSGETYGIVREVIGVEERWNRELGNRAKIW